MLKYYTFSKMNKQLFTGILVYSFYYLTTQYLEYINKVHQCLGYTKAITIIEKFKIKFTNNKEMQADLKIIEANINKNKKMFGK